MGCGWAAVVPRALSGGCVLHPFTSSKEESAREHGGPPPPAATMFGKGRTTTKTLGFAQPRGMRSSEENRARRRRRPTGITQHQDAGARLEGAGEIVGRRFRRYWQTPPWQVLGLRVVPHTPQLVLSVSGFPRSS
jgi:hypothetical protein